MRESLHVLIAFAACAAFATTQASAVSAATSPCFDKATSQAALNRCADIEARASERQVDTAYAKLQQTVSGAELRGVRADQRAWQAYRKANCESASGVLLPDSGSMAPMVNVECYTRRNDARLAYLRWRTESLEDRNRQAMP